nr:hypothetical protein [Nakamurella flavida]
MGAEPERITRRVREAAAQQAAEAAQAARTPVTTPPRRIGRGSGESEPVAPPEPSAPPGWEYPKARDQRAAVERETLKLALQQPALVAGDYPQVQPEAFLVVAYRMIHEAVEAAGGPRSAMSGPDWVTTVTEKLPAGPARSLVNELMVEPVNVGREADATYAGSILARMAERWARIQEADLRSQLQRAEAEGQQQLVQDLAADLQAMSLYRRQLGERAAGEAGP